MELQSTAGRRINALELGEQEYQARKYCVTMSSADESVQKKPTVACTDERGLEWFVQGMTMEDKR